MTQSLRPMVFLFAALLPVAAAAQSRSEQPFDANPAAATTLMGDSGLWYVPTAEVLPGGILSGGVHHATEMRDQGSSKVSGVGASLARGFGDRAEVFGSWQMTTRANELRRGSDVLAGAKLNLMSEGRGAPLALAVRSVAKIPTNSDENRAGNGKPDLLTELVAGRQFGRAAITGSTGFVWRGNPAGQELTNGIRSGVGLAVMAHPSVRLFTEVHGEKYLDEPVEARLLSPFDTPLTAAVGASWRVTHGFTVAAGVNRAFRGREEARGVGAIVRFGFRPGSSGRAVAPAPPAAPPQAVAQRVPPAPPARAAAPAPVAPARSTTVRKAFDDIQFELDRYTLRPAGLVVLDQLAATLRADTSLRVRIEGHTCEIGTAEYNLALGERRASAVRSYLISQGVAASRIDTMSFGKEHQKHGNSTEAKRALNRRAELMLSGSETFNSSSR